MKVLKFDKRVCMTISKLWKFPTKLTIFSSKMSKSFQAFFKNQWKLQAQCPILRNSIRNWSSPTPITQKFHRISKKSFLSLYLLVIIVNKKTLRERAFLIQLFFNSCTHELFSSVFIQNKRRRSRTKKTLFTWSTTQKCFQSLFSRWEEKSCASSLTRRRQR